VAKRNPADPTRSKIAAVRREHPPRSAQMKAMLLCMPRLNAADVEILFTSSGYLLSACKDVRRSLAIVRCCRSRLRARRQWLPAARRELPRLPRLIGGVSFRNTFSVVLDLLWWAAHPVGSPAGEPLPSFFPIARLSVVRHREERPLHQGLPGLNNKVGIVRRSLTIASYSGFFAKVSVQLSLQSGSHGFGGEQLT